MRVFKAVPNPFGRKAHPLEGTARGIKEPEHELLKYSAAGWEGHKEKKRKDQTKDTGCRRLVAL